MDTKPFNVNLSSSFKMLFMLNCYVINHWSKIQRSDVQHFVEDYG